MLLDFSLCAKFYFNYLCKKQSTNDFQFLGIYIPPSESNGEMIINLDKAMKNEDPNRCIIIGDLNINYRSPSKKRDLEIIETLELYGMSDISRKFKC